MSDGLPSGWVEVAVREITTPDRPRRNPQDSPSLPYVGMEHIESNTGRLLGTASSRTMKSTAYEFHPGDVLYGRLRPYLNKVHCAEFKGLCSSEFIVMPPSGACDSRYLSRYLSTPAFVSFANQLNQGDRPRVNFGQIGTHEIPLPPLAEQRRIASTLDSAFKLLDGTTKRLSALPETLRRLRQSILGAAYAGRLTADWRVAHPDVETGRQLLARIGTLRLKAAASTREQKQIAEAFEEAWLRIDITETGLESIPESWEGTRVGAIGTVVNGSTPSRSQPKLWGGAIAWVSSGEVRNNVITETRERISKAGYDSCSVRLLPPGSVLLAMIGEGKTRGQAAILEIEATINQNVAAVLIPHGLVESRFLWWWFQFQYQATRERGSGSGPQALNCQRVREIPFVLPPLAEQVEIVRRVDELLSTGGRIKQRFELASAKADKIMPSLLARAFRGELVPTEADLAAAEGRAYETAAALLERIRRGQPGSPSRSR